MENIHLIITKHLSGTVTEEDRQVLESWLQESEKNRAQLTEITQIFNTTGKLSLDLDLDTEKAWQQVASQAQIPGKQQFLDVVTPWYRIAASVIVLFSIGALIYLYTADNQTIYHTSLDQEQQIILPDKSEVWLNRNSTLSYSQDFNDNRNLKLKGEAFFEVVSDPKRPFTVETTDLLTTVVGTTFNVKAVDENSQEAVLVTSGKVKVASHRQDTDPVYLEAGTRVLYDRVAGSLQKSPNNDLNFLAWKERRLQFKNTPLNQVAQVLEEYFNISIQIDNAELAGCQFTGDFNDPSIERVLEVLAITLDISHNQSNGAYSLNGSGCTVIEN